MNNYKYSGTTPYYSPNSKILKTIHLWETRKFKTRLLKKQFDKKYSLFRNTLSCFLQLWKQHRSLVIMEKITNISHKRLYKYMKYCKSYKNRKHRIYGERLRRIYEKNKNKNTKRSEYRNKIALCLKTWKKLKSVGETSKELGIKKYIINELLCQSKIYLNRKKYSTDEKNYANIWALKLRVIKILGGQCKICGNNNPMILELHHKYQKTKENCMSDIIRKKSYDNIILKKIEIEAKKCKLLCRNCHQELHNKKIHPKNEKNKKFIMGLVKNNGKCIKCGYNRNISCLEFHHRNIKNKKFNISKLTDPRRNYDNMKISKDKLNSYIKEVKKCDVLCCNCHQIKHIKIDRFKKLRLLIQITERLLD